MSASIRLLAPAVAGVSGVLSVTNVLVAVLNASGVSEFIAGNEANTWLAGVSSGVVAVLILRVRPTHRLGHVFAASSIFAASSAAGDQLADMAFAQQPASIGGNLAWVAGTFWMPAFLLLFVGVPLLFPNGELASPRWRWPARVASLTGVVAVAAAAGNYTLVVQVNPSAVHPLGSPVPDPLLLAIVLACFAATLAVGVAASIGILLRMRHLGEPLRQQHAWYAAAVPMVLAVTGCPCRRGSYSW